MLMMTPFVTQQTQSSRFVCCDAFVNAEDETIPSPPPVL